MVNVEFICDKCGRRAGGPGLGLPVGWMCAMVNDQRCEDYCAECKENGRELLSQAESGNEIIRAAEREACAKVCEEISDGYMDKSRPETINVERSNGAEKCVTAIRRRGEGADISINGLAVDPVTGNVGVGTPGFMGEGAGT